MYLPTIRKSVKDLPTPPPNLFSKNYKLPQMQAFLSDFIPLWNMTDKYFPKPPTCYLSSQRQGVFKGEKSQAHFLSLPAYWSPAA